LAPWRAKNLFYVSLSKNLRHDDSILGELKEKTVLDANDSLPAEPVAAINCEKTKISMIIIRNSKQ